MSIWKFLKRKPNINRESPELTHTLTSREAERITLEFGRFLAERQPVIKDAELLPHPKAVIMEALVMQEQFACHEANTLKASGRSDDFQEIQRYIGVLGFIRMGLCAYSDIDSADKEVVSYFNSFRTLRDVPDDRRVECTKLVLKYISHGVESEIPGWENMSGSQGKRNKDGGKR